MGVFGVTDRPDRVIPGDEPLLETSGLSKSFGSVQALSDVSLSLSPGRIVGVIGPNGSGKTTLVRLLVGDLEPTSGTVSYRGPDADRPIGYLPQRPTFRPGFTARETLAFYTALVDGADTETLLERVGLSEAADQNVEALSGGMRRLLGVAQATVGDPPIVALDEPASGLDPAMSQRVFEAAESMTEEGQTVLINSHDMSLVAETADEVVVLARGRVAAQGPPEEIQASFDADPLRGVLESIIGESDSVAVVGGDE